MRTTVQISPGLEPTLATWERSLSSDPVIAENIATALLDTLKQRLIGTDGLPPDYLVDLTTRPQEYWCELSGGMWVVYTFTDGGFIFSRWREVVILGLAAVPSPRAGPTSPRP